MPEIYVREFKGIKAADLAFSAIALVGAGNMHGKSSLVQAVRAALTGNPLALDGSGERLTLKHSAPLMVREGAEGRCYALIVSGDNKAQIEWPKGDYTTEGSAPIRSSGVGAGVTSLATMKQSERAAFLVDLLKALPDKEALLEAITDAGVPSAEKATNFLWDKITENGWDNTREFAAARGAENKGGWNEVTGSDWGTEKGRSWVPPGWQPKWDSLTVDEAQAGVELLEKKLSDFDQQHGVAVADIEQLRQRAAALATLEAQEMPDTTALGEAVVKAEEARALLPRSPDEPEEVHPCPQCREMLAIAHGQTPPWRLPNKTRPTKKQIDDMRKRIGEANAAFLTAKDALAAAHVKIRDHERGLTEAREAAKRLDGAVEPTGAEERVKLAADVETGRAVKEKIWKRRRAAEIDSLIRSNAKLLEILAPAGLRQKMVLGALQDFNARLAEMSGWMDHAHVIVRPDMSIVNRWPGTDEVEHYWEMSASQQFRTRIILQATIAAYDGSGLIVIDNDVDQDGRWMAGTLKMLGRIGIPALVTIRADRVAQMPPVPPAGRGPDIVRYWIRDGVVEPVDKAEAA